MNLSVDRHLRWVQSIQHLLKDSLGISGVNLHLNVDVLSRGLKHLHRGGHFSHSLATVEVQVDSDVLNGLLHPLFERLSFLRCLIRIKRGLHLNVVKLTFQLLISVPSLTDSIIAIQLNLHLDRLKLLLNRISLSLRPLTELRSVRVDLQRKPPNDNISHVTSPSHPY